MTGVYASGSTCASKSGKVYATIYDGWGIATSRTTGMLTYDLLDHFTQWYVSSSNQEQYLHDASGNRVLRRTTTVSGTTMTVYAFGLEEHSYLAREVKQTRLSFC